MTSSPFVVGLTGGIGSGKSAAASRFGELGATVIDTDLIAHALTTPGGRAMPAIRDAFGDHVVTSNGALNRQAMRDRAFADGSVRKRLEAILHPLIRSESERLAAQATGAYVVLVVPLLVESSTYRERCDRVCVVDCPVELQIERVMTRNGFSETQVRAIMTTQATREARLAAADDVIDNSADLPRLLARVDQLHGIYLEARSSR